MKSWLNLDRTDPEVMRWAADGYRFPWCYVIDDVYHLYEIKRDAGHEPIWFGTVCGIEETPGLEVGRYIPNCQACIAKYKMNA